MNIKLWEGVSMLVGTIIGAGILGLPYVTVKAGIFPGVFWILFMGIVFLIVNLCLAEVVSRTNGHHQLVGLCKKYLGHWGKWFMGISFVVGVYGALVAYTVGSGDALSQIFSVSSLVASFVFYAVLVFVVLGGLKIFEEFESVFVPLLLVIIVGIAWFGWEYASIDKVPLVSWNALFLPYGAVVFAYIGTSAIPEVGRVVSPKMLKKAIIYGSVIPIIAYSVFAVIVASITGSSTTELATIGVGEVLGRTGVILLNAFAVLSMSTSFVGLSFALRHMFKEAGFSSLMSAIVTFVVPPLIILMVNSGFVRTIEVSGAISGGLAGILVMLMFFSAKKHGDKHPYFNLHVHPLVGFLICLLFVIGVLSVLV